MKMLETESIGFSFNQHNPILHDISLQVDQGQFVVITGRNGSGKSMLLKCLKGLYSVQQGVIRIDDRDVTRRPSQRNRLLGLVFQDADCQVVGQTVLKDIAFGLENLGIPQETQRHKLEEIAKEFDLTRLLDRNPQTLSGGELRRLTIASVMVMDPLVLLLDEPFANLDTEGIRGVIETLIQLHRKGTTIVLVTHEIEKVLAHADALVLMDGGTIVNAGLPSEVLPYVESHGVRWPRCASGTLDVAHMSWLIQ